MKKILLIFLFALFLLPSCKQEQDLRYIAPLAEFAAGQYAVDLEKTPSLDVEILLSRPVQEALTMEVNFFGTLEEGTQFSVPSHTVNVPAGASGANLHIDFTPDDIWTDEATLGLMLAPGTRYALSPEKNSETLIAVTKEVKGQILKLTASESSLEVNPYFPKSLTLTIEAAQVQNTDLVADLGFGGLIVGQDILIDGGTVTQITIPAGSLTASFQADIAARDQSGYESTGKISLLPKRGSYMIRAKESSLPIHIADPVVDFSKLLRTAALQSGEGYQVRQAFKTKENTWDGTTTVDLGVSSTGSNYLRNYRNMYNHPSFNCMANSATSQLLRMSDLFPNYLYPNPMAILDYGNDQGHREFTPADSVFRFVPLPDNPLKGSILLAKPRTFQAYIGSYEQWQDKSSGTNAWVLDSRATGGDISASTHPAITGTITLTLEKVEGTYDFTNRDEPVVLSAWFSSPSEQFMAGFDTEKYDVVQEGNCWKLTYKLWPR